MIEIKNDPKWEFKDRFKVLHIINKNKYSTYQDLAGALGVSLFSVFRYINGQAAPNLKVLQKIKELFPEINLNWLVSGHGDMYVS